MRIERANAKINLYLDVVGKRENGYHNIDSIMQTVSVCDLVGIDFRPGTHTSILLRASGNSQMPTDCRNLAWRAAELYLSKTGQTGEVQISIEKHIPMAAGLAGGSSDAAAVLRGLNRLCGNRLSFFELSALGATLGADIPFCLMGGGARVGGIGEVLEPIAPMRGCFLAVACMGEGVSTPWAYGRLDELYHDFAGRTADSARCERLIGSFANGSVLQNADAFYNIFEDAVPAERPSVDVLKQRMQKNGALCAMMSGSGPSVFGVFATQEEAILAVEELRKIGADAFVCHPTRAYDA